MQAVWFKIKDAFFIKEKGFALVGLLEADESEVQKDMIVKITRPEGTEITAKVKDINLFGGCFSDKRNIALLVEDTFTIEDFPRGSIVSKI